LWEAQTVPVPGRKVSAPDTAAEEAGEAAGVEVPDSVVHASAAGVEEELIL